MAPLPPAVDVFKAPYETHVRRAYTLVLGAEGATDDQVKLIHTRIVGYLLLHPINATARDHVAQQIISCSKHRRSSERNEALYSLGELYMNYFIRPFCRWRADIGAALPVGLELPPKEEIEELKCDMQKHRRLMPEPQDYESANIHALIRDDFRCMLTGKLDLPSLQKYRAVMSMPPRDIQRCVIVYPCFICGWGEPKYLERVKPEEQESQSAFWDILSSFGFPELRGELEGKHVYRLDNVMTLNTDMMSGMYCLQLWLEEVDGHEHHYVVRCADETDYETIGAPREVQFIAHANVPLPNPKYLRIHATCARVVCLSGAVRYLYDLDGSKPYYSDACSDTSSDLSGDAEV